MAAGGKRRDAAVASTGTAARLSSCHWSTGAEKADSSEVSSDLLVTKSTVVSILLLKDSTAGIVL